MCWEVYVGVGVFCVCCPVEERAVYRNFAKFCQGGANLGTDKRGGGTKEGGGSLCEVLHPTLARGRQE